MNTRFKMQSGSVAEALDRFMERALAVQTRGCFLMPFDETWRSEAELDRSPVDGMSCWKPLLQSKPVDFAGLENALEFPIHRDIKAYYSRYWAGTLEANATEGHVRLIQLWNAEDYDRLVANLIGHALAKRRAKDPFTVFFATTEADSELFLSVDNETGVVLLEEPGKSPIKQVQEGLAPFLDRLTPLDQPPEIY